MTAMPQMKSALDNRTLANALRLLAIDAWVLKKLLSDLVFYVVAWNGSYG